MIPDRQEKFNRIVDKIRNGISEINNRYRMGPDLYFYRRLMSVRNQAPNLSSFLQNDYNIEILYATLVAWDMNSRAAKMKYFDEFKGNILSTINQLQQLEKLFAEHQLRRNEVLPTLRIVYCNLELMKTRGRLVSNSKVLHFLFPTTLTPMDGKNTLDFFYGNHNESVDKYIEVTELALDIMAMPDNWQNYLDDVWNTSVPKMIDNAILLIEENSTHQQRRPTAQLVQ
jgi:hypothetical protein